MARDGNGNYSNPYPDFVSGTVINSTQVDDNNAAIATALTQSIAVDGQTTITANLPMSNFKHTGVAAGVALTEYADVKSVQNATYIDCGTAGGTANALTLSPSPAITAYVAGQVFRFKAGASPSSSTATVAVSGLTATAIQIDGAALSATVVIEAGKHYSVKYDGTVFQATRESLAVLDDDTFATASATTLASSESIKAYADARLPAGTVAYYAADAPPTGWFERDGSAISRTTYATLFAVIGTTFGVGDGSTTFNLPDGRGEFDRGWDNGRGVDTGRAFGSAQAQDIQPHTHIQRVANSVGGSNGTAYKASVASAEFNSFPTGSTGTTETRPRNIALLPIIKY